MKAHIRESTVNIVAKTLEDSTDAVEDVDGDSNVLSEVAMPEESRNRTRTQSIILESKDEVKKS